MPFFNVFSCNSTKRINLDDKIEGKNEVQEEPKLRFERRGDFSQQPF